MSQRTIAMRVAPVTSFWRAVIAGVGGTAVLTILLYAIPYLGLPKMDLPLFLGTFFFSDTQTAYLVGLTALFSLGVVLALVYAYALYRPIDRLFHEASWLRGICFGGIPWLGLMLAAPLLDLAHPMVVSGELPLHGLFMLSRGIIWPVSMLGVWLVYGGVMGAIYGDH